MNYGKAFCGVRGNMSDIQELARQSLSIMVLDLGYDLRLPPTYGHHPIRHTLLWEQCRSALGDRFDQSVIEIVDGIQRSNKGQG